MPQSGAQSDFDVVIAGASFAGLAMAKALAHASAGALRIALTERRQASPKNESEKDDRDVRAFAISAGSRYLLERLGVWADLEAEAQPVTTIEITDSSLDAGIRPVLLTYDNHLENGDPASYIVPADALSRGLIAAVTDEPSVTLFQPAETAKSEACPAGHVLTLETGARLKAALVVAADGKNSPLRSMSGIKTVNWNYDQRGIVTTIKHARPHHATAVQHFLPGGPFAILPLTGNRSCITWSEEAHEAERILAGGEALILAELDRRIGGRLGGIEEASVCQSWPLSMHLARSYAGARLALIGDAAHGVHPIAGQGLNLGFRDVAALAEVVMTSAGLGLDIGAADVLENYESWRRSDSALSAVAFDGLNRLFSNDLTLLRSLREFGLGSVDRLSGVKQMLVGEAAGQAGEVPALMRKVA